MGKKITEKNFRDWEQKGNYYYSFFLFFYFSSSLLLFFFLPFYYFFCSIFLASQNPTNHQCGRSVGVSKPLKTDKNRPSKTNLLVRAENQRRPTGVHPYSTIFTFLLFWTSQMIWQSIYHFEISLDNWG